MQLEIFDQYNIRARLSIYIIVLCPLIATCYLIFENLRTIGSSMILIIFLLSFANYFFIIQRYYKDPSDFENTAKEMLKREDKRITPEAKERYYRILSSIDKSFIPILSEADNESFEKACIEAIKWLRNNSRDNHLVQEENILYGFITNAINAKIAAYFVLFVSQLFQITLFIFYFMNAPHEISVQYLCFIFSLDLLLLLFWSLGITEKQKKFVAEKYAFALLGTIDTIKPQDYENLK